jgi:hypothetical protein
MCDPAEILLKSKFSYWLVSNLTHKTKVGTTNRWEAANGESPGPITMISQSQTWSTVRLFEHSAQCVTLLNVLHSLRQVLGFAVLFTSLRTLCKIPGPKPFCWSKLACFDFFLSNINWAPVKGQILITCGVALMLKTQS